MPSGGCQRGSKLVQWIVAALDADAMRPTNERLDLQPSRARFIEPEDALVSAYDPNRFVA
jgi:hypothetical protein